MSLLIDYFSAPDDTTAAQALTSPDERSMIIEGRRIEPTVSLAVLEGLLGGRQFEEILDDDQSYATVAISDTAEAFVIRLGERFEDLLLANDQSHLEATAPYWATAEEMEGARPADLVEFLTELQGLVTRSRDAGEHVYCLMGL
ncbi:hypothetical protein [Nakamurella panacisegetis]|nr:hypothetical protein [Nakamurella panacisegetis]